MDASSTSAVLFPGQGVGDASSRELVAAVRPDLLDLATELVGEDPFERMSEGTAYAQPAVYCASIAGYEQLGPPGGRVLRGPLARRGRRPGRRRRDRRRRRRAHRRRSRAGSWRRRPSAASPAACSPSAATATAQRRWPAEHGLTLANENSPQQFVLSGPLARDRGGGGRREGLGHPRQEARGRGRLSHRRDGLRRGAASAPRSSRSSSERREPPVISSTTAEPSMTTSGTPSPRR